ncbi:hypothetical protein [Novosphingobium sp. M1R2S20]|uniref:Lipoprotein n=1 Tax=Novosphingobium rhizovicinum TaxID=3228928 RepID=A0ABV3REH3_9SPHN
MKRFWVHLSILPCLLVAACTGGGDEAACSGILLTAPANGMAGSGSMSIAQLMAHSAAMGMTQREAETLLYLEGISPSRTLEPGETICIDGKP